MKIALHSLLALLLFSLAPGATAHSPSEQARIFFVNLQDGAVVKSPFRVQFGIQGFGIVPAGTKDQRRHHGGHFHLLIDVPRLPDLEEPIPRDAHHLHFDGGERETILNLSPGVHTLQLLLGDEAHEPFEPLLVSEKIQITVR